MIKMIAMDLDGTLLNHAGTISDATLKTLNQAHHQGIKIVLCSGRPYESAEKIIHQLNLKEKQGIYIGMNGQIIHHFSTGQSIQMPSLSKEHINELLKCAQDFSVIATIYDKNRCLIASARKKVWIAYLFFMMQKLLWIFRQNDSYKETVFLTMDEVKLESTGKICFCGFPKTLKLMEKKLNTDIFGYVYVSSCWMECQLKGISKGYALSLAAEMEQIKPHEIIAFGDGENDISMLEYAGTGIAMKNAMASVKQIADKICPSNQNDGIAAYLNQTLFKEKKDDS